MEETQQHHNRDYYVEFYEEAYRKLECLLQSWGTDGNVRLNVHDIKVALRTFLFYRIGMEKEHYNQYRRNGMTIDAAMKRMDGLLEIFKKDRQETENGLPAVLSDIKEHPWYEILNENQGVLIVYIFNARQLGYFTPLLQVVDIPVLLLSEYDIPEDTDLPETVMAVSMDFSMQRVFADKEFEYKFPLVFHYTHTFDILFRILRPCGVACLEGIYFQEQLLASVAASYDVPFFVIQQGWPSMMHAGFHTPDYIVRFIHKNCLCHENESSTAYDNHTCI